MAINRGYTPNHKFWDRIGRITPNVEYSESHRPHLGDRAMPAPWLPVSRYNQTYEAWKVVSSGKVVAEDTDGRLVPAGLRKLWNAAGATVILTYTANDVEQKVVDLTTGNAVAAATTYDEDAVTAALKERGLIRATERAMDFISKPVGIASYDFYKAPGADTNNPRTLTHHNFRPQARVAITCDYTCTYPVLPAKETTETMNGAISDTIDWSTARTGGWFSSTGLNGLVKYAGLIAAGDDIVGYVFEKFPMAHITQDTPITVSVTAGLVTEVASVTAISAAGDYFIDTDLGILFLYEEGGDAIPSPFSVAATVTYYHYEDAVTYSDARTSTYGCATGNLEFGDFLTYDENSNLIKAVLDIGTAEGYDGSFALYSADPEYDSEATNSVVSIQLEKAIENWMQGIVGQVIGVEEYPKDYLERVRTEFEGQTDVTLQTPGSATQGRSDQLTYAGGAERMVVVNLILR
jgi:hypothetical protein